MVAYEYTNCTFVRTVPRFRTFLTCRRQRVVINGQTSNWLDVRSGVPQGSVLGPLLFILYIDDLHRSVTGSTLKIFADDVTIYKVVTSVSDCRILQEDLSHIFCWTAAWQVRLNSGKCEALNITNKQAPIQFDYTVNGGVIQWKPFVRYLGIYVNSKLTWSDHCKIIASKATMLLNVYYAELCLAALEMWHTRALLGLVWSMPGCHGGVESPH